MFSASILIVELISFLWLEFMNSTQYMQIKHWQDIPEVTGHIKNPKERMHATHGAETGAVPSVQCQIKWILVSQPLPCNTEASGSLVTKLLSGEGSLFLLRQMQWPAKKPPPRFNLSSDARKAKEAILTKNSKSYPYKCRTKTWKSIKGIDN